MDRIAWLLLVTYPLRCDWGRYHGEINDVRVQVQTPSRHLVAEVSCLFLQSPPQFLQVQIFKQL